MSIDQYQETRSQHDVFITCPTCGEWLWNEIDQQFLTSCPACEWQDRRNAPLPPELERALIYLRDLIEKVHCGLELTANEKQLLAQAGVYAQGDQK